MFSFCHLTLLGLCSGLVAAHAGGDGRVLFRRASVESRPRKQRINPADVAQAKEAWAQLTAEGRKPLDHSSARREIGNGRANASLCDYVSRALLERRSNGTPVSANSTVSSWPGRCALPSGFSVARDGQRAEHAVALHSLKTCALAESAWKQLPLGGILVVDSLMSQPAEARNLIWQSIYQLNARLYTIAKATPFHGDFGFRHLDFFVVFGDHAILQKSLSPTQGDQWPSGGEDLRDLQRADGVFLDLAKKAGTDKIDGVHNYQLLYHRILDPWNLHSATAGKKQGMFLEIGLGCTMNYGAGASAKIWPKMFPDLSVHFVELDRECTNKFLPQMKAVGVDKVHIGSQADEAVLAEIVEDAWTFEHGLRLVVDDGSHEPKHIEASFRGLFQHMTPGGIYVVEDMMYSGWATSYGQSLISGMSNKTRRTDGGPMSLASVLATAAAGVPEFFNFPAKTWSQNLLVDYGPLVESVQCSPGVCSFTRLNK